MNTRDHVIKRGNEWNHYLSMNHVVPIVALDETERGVVHLFLSWIQFFHREKYIVKYSAVYLAGIKFLKQSCVSVN